MIVDVDHLYLRVGVDFCRKMPGRKDGQCDLEDEKCLYSIEDHGKTFMKWRKAFIESKFIKDI